MKMQENILLKDLTTFRIGGLARYFTVVKNEEDLHECFVFAKSRKLPIFVLGGGSNVLISDYGFNGLVIKNEIKGIKFADFGADQVLMTVGAGEVWDDVVALSIMRNLSGLENLSGIPGTVGGAAVQNAGAYGMELEDCLMSVAGLNSINGKKFVLAKIDCQYGYRNSLFKKNKKYVITSVSLKLSKKSVVNLDYAGLKDRLINQKKITPAGIRDNVLQIRTEKLPDWHKLGTAGSFFKNPIITSEQFDKLKARFPDLPGFLEPKNQIKISLAWVLDKICQLKGYCDGKVGLYEKQPIVLVNFGGATGKEVFNFAEKIKNIVKEKTGIVINEEVEMI